MKAPGKNGHLERRQTDAFVDLRRREFLQRFSQTAGAGLIAARLPFLGAVDFLATAGPQFQFHPHYRSERPLDSTLRKLPAGADQFLTEKYAEEISDVLSRWSLGLRQSPGDASPISNALAGEFSGASLLPGEWQVIRDSVPVHVKGAKLSNARTLTREQFLKEWTEGLKEFSAISTAEFQVTSIDVASSSPFRVRTVVRYELVGTGPGFHREQRIGAWDLEWERDSSGQLYARNWLATGETRARAAAPVYVDVSQAALGSAPSFSAQFLHGSDYWRTLLDGACGIDIYGHNGLSVADIDGDGFDDLYVCQPAGLPNRLFRNRGDGTFEDITETSGLGILENTACALFADFRNRGRQDVIVVRADGPSLFENDGKGKFREKPEAFHFSDPPQGTFTGAALADYDRDGWLDIYFCLYAFYQGAGQYRYPSPYYDANNGPPNFLLRNNHDGTFRDVTAESGLNQNNTRYSFCCGWNDYNGDGWPDLYVVNDFGRKNLYRNNGNGTFIDVAAQVGVEDVGAGMGVTWFDADNDGAEDLYVANMWTAAGERVSAQSNFQPDAPPETRSLYRKHAMGNSLFRNRGAKFENATSTSNIGMGRWSWGCDAFDFDHDGFADLYVTNGMVSGPSRNDLNSFFWRQVVANSRSSAGRTRDYEQGWDAINELVRADGTWSGYERNVFYSNNRDGTFSNVSAAIGLDFIEDGRSFALSDFDHDGRVEVFLKNRNGPQLRLLRNVVGELPPSISFCLQGTKSNRDAIGATITIGTSSGIQRRSIFAGSGFLSQHSKEIVFGLGDSRGNVHASIRWPSGETQEFGDLPHNHRVSITEGARTVKTEPFRKPTGAPALKSEVADRLPEKTETWLVAPLAAPDFSLLDRSGKIHSLAELRGSTTLLTFLAASLPSAIEKLESLQEWQERWSSSGLQTLAIVVDSDDLAMKSDRRFSFPVLRSSDDVAAVYNILYRQMFDRHRDMTMPVAFLLDAGGAIVKVYQGGIDPEHVTRDFQQLPRTDDERLSLALPFPTAGHRLQCGRNYLSYGALFYQRGYLDEAEAAFQQALRDDPSSAEALYGIGSVYLNQNKNAAAREAFEQSVKLTAGYPGTLADAWNNLGVIATRENRVSDAIQRFENALRENPNHLLALDNLGNAHRQLKQWSDARKILERALAIAPEDAEANYSMGMVFAQNNDTDKAYEYLQRALKAKPAYPEALNNLGILYLLTQRRDQAVESFEECIRVAPGFDQAYLNLARVYTIEGAKEKARSLLFELLKRHPDDAQAKQALEQLQ